MSYKQTITIEDLLGRGYKEKENPSGDGARYFTSSFSGNPDDNFLHVAILQPKTRKNEPFFAFGIQFPHGAVLTYLVSSMEEYDDFLDKIDGYVDVVGNHSPGLMNMINAQTPN